MFNQYLCLEPPDEEFIEVDTREEKSKLYLQGRNRKIKIECA